MKTTVYLLAIVLVLFTRSSFSDIIPEGHHGVFRCVKIVNLDSFPSIAVIGVVTGPTTPTFTAFEIKNDSCISKGYKFNQIHLFATQKSNLSTALSSYNFAQRIENIDKEPILGSTILYLKGMVDPYGGTVPDSILLIKEEYHLTIKGVQELIVVKKIRTYSDGKIEIDSITPTNNRVKPKGKKLSSSVVENVNLTRNMLSFKALASGTSQVIIYNCSGRTVQKFSLSTKPLHNYTRFLSLPSGFYWISFTNINNVNSSYTFNLL